MKLFDWILIILMIGAILFGGIYYYQKNIQECTKNPLVFSAKLYEQNYPVKANGILTLYPKLEGQSPTHISFNSKTFTVEEY